MKRTTENLAVLFSVFISVFSMIVNENSAIRTGTESKHFVLVHGACHGAWSWFKLAALLRSSGHNVTALDLSASGINQTPVKDIPSISDYFRPLTEFMSSLPEHEKVILVGHSFGGVAISYSMERFPVKISVAVFVTALMPGPTLNISTLVQESLRGQDSLLDSKYTYDDGPEKPPTTFIFGPVYLAQRVYQFSPVEDWTLATLLIRPLRLYSEEDMSQVILLSDEKYGSVRRVFVLSDGDKTLKEDFQRWMIGRNPPHQVAEMKGSDHMVMLSNPNQLLDCLALIS